jgi:regulation of enolase protein 1 (concanavalin A-like superfamily)
MRRVALPVTFLVAGAAIAAPVPKDESGRIQRVYGSTHDTDKGAEFRNVGDVLHISLLSEPRLLAPFRRIANAPRVWREVRGNFTATVRVSFPIRPTLPPTHKDAAESRAGGGLVVWLGDENFLTVTRDERACDGEPGEYFRSEFCRKGITAGSADYAAPAAAGYVRVYRWAKGLECSYSRDAKKWTPVGSYAIAWDEDLKVGVVAENGFRAPFDVAFDEYKLKPEK